MFNEEKIIQFLWNKEKTYYEIVKELNIPYQRNKDFSSFLNQMVDEKKIFKNFVGKFYYQKPVTTIKGIIKINPKGFAFVDYEEEKSVFLPKGNFSNTINGDEVEVNIYEDKKRIGEFFGFVSKIITRNTKELVGYIKRNGDYLDFVAHDPRLKNRFRISRGQIVNENDVIRAKIKEIKNDIVFLEVIKILGTVEDAFIDIQMSIENANVPYVFQQETLNAAKFIPENIDDENKDGRIDLRKEVIVTIDGDDTKDFDDAISVKKLENGNYLLGVHIADVTHYVKEGDDIDKEAALRGTSIYLADRVIPMLPESLSNGICSLNPNVDRFTITMECEINSKGENEWVKFYPSIINSYSRLTYKEVNDFYDGKKEFDENITSLLSNAKELANIIRKYKNDEGYIDFEIEESKIVLDEKGKPIDIIPRERGESEILIEDFMVRANENIAKFMYDKKLPFIYRIHDVPEVERLIELTNVLKLLKINVEIPLSINPRDFANAIRKVKEINFDDFIKIMMLRTMSKAVYSSINIGHFGLASEYYTHFTSPIRRYPDLLVHRLLRTLVFENQSDKIDHFKSILEEHAQSSSMSEQSAVSLERAVADIKKAEFYENKIGQVFKGQITSVKKFGFFVEFNNKVDVLVHVSNLSSNDFELDENGLMIKNSKEIYKVGDFVEVVIVGTFKAEGKIDAVLSKDYELYKNKNTIK